MLSISCMVKLDELYLSFTQILSYRDTNPYLSLIGFGSWIYFARHSRWLNFRFSCIILWLYTHIRVGDIWFLVSHKTRLGDSQFPLESLSLLLRTSNCHCRDVSSQPNRENMPYSSALSSIYGRHYPNYHRRWGIYSSMSRHTVQYSFEKLLWLHEPMPCGAVVAKSSCFW